MDRHRLVESTAISFETSSPPFSFFDYIEQQFPRGGRAIHRLFSLARSHDVSTFVVEHIPPQGNIEDENKEILDYLSDYTMTDLRRISFWKGTIATEDDLASQDENSCIGYCILKNDNAPSRSYRQWHIYEAVFRKYDHAHNCVPNQKCYRFRVGCAEFTVPGVLYAQQNTLNKVCAHVALRSLLSRNISAPDVSYRQINDLAKAVTGPAFDPQNGLRVPHIRAVLDGFGVNYRDIDYALDDSLRENIPYQKLVYSGIESGQGALLGFTFPDPDVGEDVRHIIPFYGHTFNKDTWAPDADVAYFHLGEKLGYVPSESWTSSFLGHDDNFGPNFCIPRLYVDRSQVDYGVEILQPGIQYTGATAEAFALQFLYSVLPQIDASNNNWLKRLAYYADPDIQRVVLRAITVSRDTYISQLGENTDWYGNSEAAKTIEILGSLLPDVMWMVEVSIPQLFPANERKLGEILLESETPIDPANLDVSEHFILTRLPGAYLFAKRENGAHAGFIRVPSQLQSHLPLLEC